MRKTPVVVILGHVDHGKTTLLDRIRTSSISLSEPGGITQSIGAYQVSINGSLITFIDTPGHEAFSAMRSQGADVADLAVLVVAADDGVKPQTLEALQTTNAAHLPIIVAINKIDLPQANVDEVKKDLAAHGCVVEGYGGSVPTIEISAKKGTNMTELLELVQLLYALEEKPANETGKLRATVIESTKDSRVGPISSVIVESGTLRKGDDVETSGVKGRIRALYDDRKKPINECLPGCPAQVVGLPQILSVGSVIVRKGDTQETGGAKPSEKPRMTPTGNGIRILLKSDSQGTLAALSSIVPQAATVIHQSVGDVTESDVLLAEGTKALIVGLRVKIPLSVAELARAHRVSVITDTVIYALSEQLTALVKQPVSKEIERGRATVQQVFHIGVNQIAGCHVESGRLAVNDTVHLVNGNNSADAVIKQLKQKSADATTIQEGQECGVLLAAPSGKPLNIRERSVIIAFQKSDESNE